MHKSIIVAAATNGTIGRDNQLPWHLPRDLQHFRRLTMGHHVIVGRKTFESIGKPLPGRTLIVVTRNQHYHAPGCTVVHDLAAALRLAEQAGETEAFIAGGGSIYQEALAWADKIYLTAVKATVEGDTFFPTLSPNVWRQVSHTSHQADEQHTHDYDFLVLKRNGSPKFCR